MTPLDYSIASELDADGWDAEFSNAEIGVPNVPAIVWHEEQKRARKLLDQGLCPRHGTPLRDTGSEEICDECEAQR